MDKDMTIRYDEMDEDMIIYYDEEETHVYYNRMPLFYRYRNHPSSFEPCVAYLFCCLCHKKKRNTVTQKDYDDAIRCSVGKNNVHMIINYLIVKHDIGIIIKMHVIENHVYYDKYVMQGIGK